MKALKYKIWVEEEGEMFLGHGRAALLEAIDREGSISAAARSMKMSYKKAWEQIDHMNQLSNGPLVTTAAGGAGGGGARLTERGSAELHEFRRLNQSITSHVEEIQKTLN